MGQRYIGTEIVEAWYLTTVTILAPTAAECNAGVDLTGFIVANGLELPETGRTVDSSDAGSRRDKTVAGTYGGDVGSIEFHREKPKAQDTVWATLPRLTVGYLVVPAYGLATAGTFAIADVVDVFPIEVTNRNRLNLMGRTETLRGRCDLAITDDITEGFAIVA